MRDLKFHAISIIEPTDFNLSVRTLLIALIADRDMAVFDFNRPRRDAARQFTMSRIATGRLHIPVEDLIHGRHCSRRFLYLLFILFCWRGRCRDRVGSSHSVRPLRRTLLLLDFDRRRGDKWAGGL